MSLLSPLMKKGSPLIEQNPRLLCTELDRNGSSESGEIFFLVEFHHVAIISPLKRTHGPSFQQTWIPITQRCLVPSLVEIGPLLLEEKTRNVKSLQRQLTTDKIRLCMTVEMKHQQK